MLTRLVPHPLLSLTLILVWLGLVNTLTLGNLILGTAFGLVIPMLTAPTGPTGPPSGGRSRSRNTSWSCCGTSSSPTCRSR
jgi:multisubunit Na+/H+ antiporter MnhE subunit